MIALWAYANGGDARRIERAPAPQWDPPSGYSALRHAFAWVTITCQGFHIRYRTSLNGYPPPPETLDDGIGGMSPVTFPVQAGQITYATAVAFDTTGALLPSIPVQAWWERR